MKVAIPLFGTRIAPRFGFAPEVLVAEINGGSVVGGRTIVTTGINPQQTVALLAGQGVTTIICSGISGFWQNIVAARGIRLIPGVVGEVEDVLTAFAAGKLQPDPVAPAGGRGRHRNRRRSGGRPWRKGL